MTNPFVQEILEKPDDPLGGASGEKRRFRVEFLGKTGNSDFPFTVANEVVATQLAIALGLNVPSVLTHTMAGNTFVLVQMFQKDPRMQHDPPATSRALEEYTQQHSWEAHGAMVFDLFVANNDRAFGPQRRNLALDASGRLFLYDFGNSCYYRNRSGAGIQAGIPRLDAVEGDLGAMFDMNHKGNVYFQLMNDWPMVENWCNRIRELPDFLMESAIARIPEDVPTPNAEERARLVQFLVKRKHYLLEHIRQRKSLFPNLPL